MKSLLRKLNRKVKTATQATVTNTVRDYSNEEFFVKKAEAAKEIIAKFGYPISLSIEK
jgi:hypothetical protein